MKRALTAGGLSGLMLALTHACTPFLGPLAAAPLLYVLRRASARQALWAGLVAGFGEASVLAGVMHSSRLLAVAVCLFIASTRAVFAVGVVALGGGRGVWGPPCVAALWAALEVGAAHVPFTLPALLGDTQHVGPWLPLARLGGTYLVSAMLVWVSAWLAAFYEARAEAPQTPAPWRNVGLQALAYVALFVLLRQAALHATPRQAGSVRVAIVQGGLPTWFYTAAENHTQAVSPETVYTTLTDRAPAAALTIWPETAVWRLWDSDAAWTREVTALAHTRGPMLLGTPRQDKGQALFNSAVLVGDGPPRYVDKQRLALRAEAFFTPGAPHGPLMWGHTPLGVVFCLESVVPAYTLEQVRGGAAAVVALVEGSRFGLTPVGRMHAQRSQLRAVESGRAIVHAGQHGYSHIASPVGVSTAMLPAFHGDVVAQDVPLYVGSTPFLVLGVGALTPLWGLLAWAYARRLAAWVNRLRSQNSRP